MSKLLLLLLLFGVEGRRDDEVLRDFPIISEHGVDGVVYLDGNDWNVSCIGTGCPQMGNINVNGRVPGDLITDLETAGVLKDPLYEVNFKNASEFIWKEDAVWRYTKTFSIRNVGYFHFLVFDGVKMGARIKVNGVVKGIVSDQFQRVIIKLKRNELSSVNELQVEFDREIDEGGRYMASSGGWDWAPFTGTYHWKDDSSRWTMTRGIWKSVYLVESSVGVALTAVVPQIYQPDKFVQDDWEFKVTARLYFTSIEKEGVEIKKVSLKLQDWGIGVEEKIRLDAGEGVITIELNEPATAERVHLWWPNGYGSQELYDLNVCFEIQKSSEVCTIREIGFRSIALVTGNDTDPNYVARAESEEGSSTHGMYYRINGKVIYARGSNVIPMDEMEGRYEDEAFERLIKNCVLGKFTMLRVWGGGVFMPRAFYQAADRHGIMLFHDMMYAQRGHSPEKSNPELEEFRHQIRRLSHHVSIVVWNGCNECQVIPSTPTEVYATFVLETVVQEDMTRAIWPSCPSKGWESGVHRLTSLPLEKSRRRLVARVSTAHEIETHGPYTHGTGFPARNGVTKLDLFDPGIPPMFNPLTNTGLDFPNVFRSEFGAVTMSSYESMSATLAPEHHSLHGGVGKPNCTNDMDFNHCSGVENPMSERNYPCDSIILSVFGLRLDLDRVGEKYFRSQLYLCMFAQALHMKALIELKRSENEFGCLTWQLNEIWPTGGWGSVEYATPRPGQIIGGRWKPLHHWFAETLYTDEFVACGLRRCFYRFDREPDGRDGLERIAYIHDIYRNGTVTNIHKESIKKDADRFRAHYLDFDGKNVQEPFVRIITVVNDLNETIVQNTGHRSLQLGSKEDTSTALLKATVKKGFTSSGSIEIEIESTETVSLVYLSTLAQGQFETNGFTFIKGVGRTKCLIEKCPSPHRILFIPHVPHDEATRKLLEKTLSILHMDSALQLLRHKDAELY